MSWYRGSLPKEQVIRIVIVPEMKMGSSAEAWHSDELQADCCLQDGQLFLCGSCIRVLPGLFSGFVFVQEIQGLECLDCSKTEDLSDLFHGCAFLRQLNLKAWNTGKVRNFQNCFRGCTLLKEVDLSAWDLSSAENLSGMFMECSSLEKLDLEQWNTEQVRDLSFCFAHCKKLRNLSLSSWDTAAIRQADSLFEGCLSLQTVDVSRWNLRQAESLSRMFMDCSDLEQLPVEQWMLAKAKNLSWMFSGCSKLKQLKLSKWKCTAVEDLSGLFNRCSSLEVLKLKGWNTAMVRHFDKLFHLCSSLKELELSHFHFSTTASMNGAFVGCSALLHLPEEPALKTLAPGERWMKNCKRPQMLHYITRINLRHGTLLPSRQDHAWAADERNSGSLCCVLVGDQLHLCAQYEGEIFANQDSRRAFTIMDETGRSWLQKIEGLEQLNCSKAEDLSEMFAGNEHLQELSVGHFDLRKAKNLSRMFAGCYKLKRLDVSRWNLSNVSILRELFRECRWLMELAVENWDTCSVQDMGGLFDGCSWLHEVDVSRWSVEEVRDMSCLFRGCMELQGLNLSHWNTKNLLAAPELFRGCLRLQELDLSGFDWSRCSDCRDLLLYCPAKLKSADPLFYRLEPRNYWQRGDWQPGEITRLSIEPDFEPDWKEDECWAVDQRHSGSLLCFRYDNELVLYSRGASIQAAEDSSKAFCFESKAWDGRHYSRLESLEGLEWLDRSLVKQDWKMFGEEQKG